MNKTNKKKIEFGDNISLSVLLIIIGTVIISWFYFDSKKLPVIKEKAVIKEFVDNDQAKIQFLDNTLDIRGIKSGYDVGDTIHVEK